MGLTDFLGNLAEDAWNMGKGLGSTASHVITNPEDLDDILRSMPGAIKEDVSQRYGMLLPGGRPAGEFFEEAYEHPGSYLFDALSGAGAGYGAYKGAQAGARRFGQFLDAPIDRPAFDVAEAGVLAGPQYRAGNAGAMDDVLYGMGAPDALSTVKGGYRGSQQGEIEDVLKGMELPDYTDAFDATPYTRRQWLKDVWGGGNEAGAIVPGARVGRNPNLFYEDFGGHAPPELRPMPEEARTALTAERDELRSQLPPPSPRPTQPRQQPQSLQGPGPQPTGAGSNLQEAEALLRHRGYPDSVIAEVLPHLDETSALGDVTRLADDTYRYMFQKQQLPVSRIEEADLDRAVQRGVISPDQHAELRNRLHEINARLVANADLEGRMNPGYGGRQGGFTGGSASQGMASTEELERSFGPATGTAGPRTKQPAAHSAQDRGFRAEQFERRAGEAPTGSPARQEFELQAQRERGQLKPSRHLRGPQGKSYFAPGTLEDVGSGMLRRQESALRGEAGSMIGQRQQLHDRLSYLRKQLQSEMDNPGTIAPDKLEDIASEALLRRQEVDAVNEQISGVVPSSRRTSVRGEGEQQVSYEQAPWGERRYAMDVKRHAPSSESEVRAARRRGTKTSSRRRSEQSAPEDNEAVVGEAVEILRRLGKSDDEILAILGRG